MKKILIALGFLLLLIPLTILAQGLSPTDELHLTRGEGGMPSLNDAIVFYNLDEASDVRFDTVGTGCGGAGCDLTNNNTVTQAAGVSAQTVYAAQFVRANAEYLSHVDNASLSMGDIDFTFTAWIRLDTLPANMRVLSKDDAVANREYLLQALAGTPLRFIVFSDGTGATATAVTANSFGIPPTLTWLFVALSHDAAANTISIQVNNGAIDSAVHNGGVFDGISPFLMGTRVAGLEHWDGRVDAVGLWKGRILTPAELTWLYNGGQGRQWPFSSVMITRYQEMFASQYGSTEMPLAA